MAWLLAVAAMGVLFTVFAPARAAAAAGPTVSIGAATGRGTTTETLTGAVNPNGSSTTYSFQWDLDSTSWCTSGGTSGSPTNSTSPMNAGSGTSAQNVAANIGSLIPGGSYCWQLVATNGGGTSSSGVSTFAAGLPGAVTIGVVDVSGTGGGLQGELTSSHG
jgi:hypothetical protein